MQQQRQRRRRRRRRRRPDQTSCYLEERDTIYRWFITVKNCFVLVDSIPVSIVPFFLPRIIDLSGGEGEGGLDLLRV